MTKPDSATLAAGTVKWWNPGLGYGFIVPNSAGLDIFVHSTAVQRAGLLTLNEGDAVEYQIAKGRDGRRCAENLELK